MSTAAVISSSPSGPIVPSGGGTGGARASRRKQRCWLFEVVGARSNGESTELQLLASVRERYTTVKRLVVRPAAGRADGSSDRNIVVEVQFTGPQPSEGPGALLCDLLGGVSVEAKPVELPRGRKKRARMDTASPEASDSDVEDGGSKRMGGHRSTNSLGRMDEDEEDESPGSGRCVTAKTTFSGQGGSPVYRGKPHDAAVFRRNSSRDGGRDVAPSSGLGALSTAGIFKGATGAEGSCRALVLNEDACSLPGFMPALSHRVVSNDSTLMRPSSSAQQQLQTFHQQQLQALQQQQQQQQQQFGRPVSGGGTQWDDVVRRMTTPQGSGHSLEIGSGELSSNGSQLPVKPEFEPLLVTSNNSLGNWSSNDSQAGLLSPMPPPQSVQPPLRGWSFDSSQAADSNATAASAAAAAAAAAGVDLVDLADMEKMFRSDGEGSSTAVAAAASTATASPTSKAAAATTSPGSRSGSDGSAPVDSRDSSADAGAGRQQTSDEVRRSMPNPKWANENESNGHLPMEKVVIEPSRKECDFEGKPNLKGDAPSTQAPISVSSDRQCHLVFTGLNKTGQDLQSLRVTAHFGVDSVHKVGKVTSPIQVG
ncbi:unnamed protein product, partial [Hapterophycus canaliculatus]